MGDNLMVVCSRVLNGYASIKQFNPTHVMLLPKTQGPKKVSKFRSISLCSIVYKVVAKSLENNLQSNLHYIISYEQSAFVPGRLISDNVIVAYEAMHSLLQKNGG